MKWQLEAAGEKAHFPRRRWEALLQRRLPNATVNKGKVVACNW